jgi:O-antigen/teichoic acid export membrane protein
LSTLPAWLRGPFRRRDPLPLGEGGGAILSALAARSLAGGGWALLSLGLGLALGVARTMVVARFLGAEELGVFGIALLALGTVEAVTSTGVETALVSHPGEAEEDLDPAFTIQVLRGLLVAAAVFAAAPLAASFLGSGRATPVIRAVAVLALLRGLANPALALATRRMEFGRLFWWSVPEQVAGFVLAVGLAVARRDVWALVAAAVGSQVVAVAASWAMLPRRPRLVLRGEGVRRLLHYGKWVSGARTMMFLSLNADNAVVARFLGAGALGIYQLAFRIGELGVSTFTRAMVQVALPVLSQLQASPARLGRAFRAVFRLALVANAVFAVGVALFAHPVVERLLGREWLPAVPVLRILAVAMVFRAVVVVSNQLFNAVGRPSLTLQVNAVRLGVMLAAVLPLLHAFGLRGVALSVLLGGLASAVLCLHRARGVLEPERVPAGER